MGSSSHRPEFNEGPDAAQKFERTMTRILSVSKEELVRREAAHQKSQRPKKRRAVRPSAR